jgi:hypothetical protein
MKLASFVVASAVFAFAIPRSSYAQSKCDSIQPSSSSGLTLAVTKVLTQKDVTIQFIISNTTNGRVYLKSAQSGDIGKAFLGSGAHLNASSAASIETTRNTGPNCLLTQSCTQNLNEFSYIEPDKSLPFSFKYNYNLPIAADDTISFSVVMVARFSKATDGPDHAGDARLVRFNFNAVPLGC